MILGNHCLSMAGIIPNLLSIVIEGSGCICAEIAGIQTARSKSETVQGVSVLEDTIQQNAIFLLRQRRLTQGIVPVVKGHDQVSSFIEDERVRPAIRPVVIRRPLAVAHIQPVVLTAGVMEHGGSAQHFSLLVGQIHFNRNQ